MATAKKGESSGIYQRLKDATGKWKYQSIREGRGLQTGDLKGTFFTRIVKPGAKWQSWVHLDGETLRPQRRHWELWRLVLTPGPKVLLFPK